MSDGVQNKTCRQVLAVWCPSADRWATSRVFAKPVSESDFDFESGHDERVDAMIEILKSDKSLHRAVALQRHVVESADSDFRGTCGS